MIGRWTVGTTGGVAGVAASELTDPEAGSATGRGVEDLHPNHSGSPRFRACSERAWLRVPRSCWRLCWRCLLVACHVSFQRRVQTALRNASMGLTLCRSKPHARPF